MWTNVVSRCRTFRRHCCHISRYSTQRHQVVLPKKNEDVNAFVSFSPNALTASTKTLPLSDLTIALKDNIVTKSLPTTCSSAMLEHFKSPFDATVVELLQAAGADILGKTNCDEFGMGSLNVHSIHGPVVNPINTSEQRSTGGSSGGSAAAVAAGMCDGALGTDTGGSVRLPASYCGVVGLKPSYGLISRVGVVSYADSLDCVGVLAKNVDTTERIFGAISRYDPLDPTAAPPQIREQAFEQTSERLSSKGSILSGLRIGVPLEYFPVELSPEIVAPVRAVIDNLKTQGATIVPVSLPSTAYALSSYYVLASAEASSNLARYNGVQFGLHVSPPQGTDISKTSKVYAHSRSAGFGAEVQKRILLGTYALSADAFDNYFLQAQRVRQLVQDDYDRVFGITNHFTNPPSKEHVESHSESPRVDVLLHPSTIRTAPLLSEGHPGGQSNLSAYVQDVLTVPASLAGLPALSVPINLSKVNLSEDDENMKWPIGISVVGQWGTDELILAVGKAIEDMGSVA